MENVSVVFDNNGMPGKVICHGEEFNVATIKKYIKEQEKHDIALDKLSVKEYEDPFKGC